MCGMLLAAIAKDYPSQGPKSERITDLLPFYTVPGGAPLLPCYTSALPAPLHGQLKGLLHAPLSPGVLVNVQIWERGWKGGYFFQNYINLVQITVTLSHYVQTHQALNVATGKILQDQKVAVLQPGAEATHE